MASEEWQQEAVVGEGKTVDNEEVRAEEGQSVRRGVWEEPRWEAGGGNPGRKTVGTGGIHDSEPSIRGMSRDTRLNEAEGPIVPSNVGSF